MGPGPGARGEFVPGVSRRMVLNTPPPAPDPSRGVLSTLLMHDTPGLAIRHAIGALCIIERARSRPKPSPPQRRYRSTANQGCGREAPAGRESTAAEHEPPAVGLLNGSREGVYPIARPQAPGNLDGAPPPPAPDPSHAFSPHSRAARPPARRSAPPQSATWPPAGSSGSPAATQSSRPPSMLWASKPAPRRASAAIAERAPLRQ